MLGEILNPNFVKLLDEIAQHFRVQEQNDFESYDLNLSEQYDNHAFLKYVDLSIAMADTHIELDPEVAIRLMKLSKYAPYIGCDYANRLVVKEDPETYFSIEGMIVHFEEEKDNYHNYNFVLWKYEYQN